MEKEIEKLIIFWLKSSNENTTFLARQIKELYTDRQKAWDLMVQKIKKLEFIIENGLGEDDFKNDCT